MDHYIGLFIFYPYQPNSLKELACFIFYHRGSIDTESRIECSARASLGAFAATSTSAMTQFLWKRNYLGQKKVKCVHQILIFCGELLSPPTPSLMRTPEQATHVKVSSTRYEQKKRCQRHFFSYADGGGLTHTLCNSS